MINLEEYTQKSFLPVIDTFLNSAEDIIESIIYPEYLSIDIIEEIKRKFMWISYLCIKTHTYKLHFELNNKYFWAREINKQQKDDASSQFVKDYEEVVLQYINFRESSSKYDYSKNNITNDKLNLYRNFISRFSYLMNKELILR